MKEKLNLNSIINASVKVKMYNMRLISTCDLIESGNLCFGVDCV